MGTHYCNESHTYLQMDLFENKLKPICTHTGEIAVTKLLLFMC